MKTNRKIQSLMQIQPHLRGAVFAVMAAISVAFAIAGQESGGQQQQKKSPTYDPRATGPYHPDAQTIKEMLRQLDAGARRREVAIDHELLPYYLKARDLQREGKIKELDAFLMKVTLAKLGTMPYAYSRYGYWMDTTLMQNLMKQDDMKSIWMALGSPKTKTQMGFSYLKMASAAYMGHTYLGEYALLRKELNIHKPELRSERVVDFGDCPKGVEVFAMYRFNESIGDSTLSDMEKKWGIRYVYNHLLPGNDDWFFAWLSFTWDANPPAALAALRRHFPNGEPASVKANLGNDWEYQTITYNGEHPSKKLGKYLGPNQ